MTHAVQVGQTRRGLPRWAKVLLWTGGTLAVLAGLAVAWFVAMMSGGIDQLFNGPGPFEDDARVVAARDEVRPLNEDALAAVIDGPAAAALPAARLASAADASCSTGQHNWKIDDGYDLSCHLSDAALVGAGTAETFGSEMLALHDGLVAAGWTATGSSSLPSVVAGYWDDRDQILGANPGMAYPADLPSAGYVLADELLSVSWTQPGTASMGGYEYREEIGWTTGPGTRVTVGDVPGLVPAGTYGLVLVMSRAYFED